MDDDVRFDLNELHDELLKLLELFDSYCRNNGIEYSLAYGSLLGSVRHRGFIPWDDDIDVMLTRDNYIKLIDCLRSSPFHRNYKVSCPLWLEKIVSVSDEEVSLDLFVLDNVPDNKALAILKKYLVLMMQGMMKSKFSNKGNLSEKVLSILTGVIGRIFSIKAKQCFYKKISCISNKKKTKRIAIYNGVYKYVKTKTYSRELIKSLENVQFDSVMAMKFVDHDLFLKETYGNYMLLPPQCERIPSHLMN